MTIFDFNEKSDISSWTVVDDVVMGGQSDGRFSVNDNGHGVFKGTVSLENNGGFSSVRYRFERVKVQKQNKFVIRLKGDGKSYQFRVKTDGSDRHSYIYHIETTGEWETIEVPFAEMYPGFRGRKLAMVNFPGEEMEEIAILIANKKPESFELEIDKIEVK